MKETICWTCKFCTRVTLPNPNYKNNNNENKFFICPWVTQYKPVPGWSATETKLKVAPKQTIDSYLVHECPYYVADLEAKIAAMTPKEIAAKLEVSSAFVEKHLKLSRQILYIYTNQYNKKAKTFFAETGKKGLSAKTRYEMKRDIVIDMLISAQEELEDSVGEANDSSDDVRYNITLKQIVPSCQGMLRQLKRNYKARKNAAAARAEAKAEVKIKVKTEVETGTKTTAEAG